MFLCYCEKCTSQIVTCIVLFDPLNTPKIQEVPKIQENPCRCPESQKTLHFHLPFSLSLIFTSSNQPFLPYVCCFTWTLSLSFNKLFWVIFVTWRWLFILLAVWNTFQIRLTIMHWLKHLWFQKEQPLLLSKTFANMIQGFQGLQCSAKYISQMNGACHKKIFWMRVKNLKALFRIFKHCNCIDANS